MAFIKQQFTVSGMHCGSCGSGIEILLSSKDGVISASVDFKTGRASVEYDKERISTEKIIEDIEMLGYEAELSSS